MASKKKPANKKAPKIKGQRKELTPKQSRYIAKRTANPAKPRTECAREAGYSESMALKARRDIEGSLAVSTLLKDVIRDLIPPGKIAKRIDEAMDAMETKFFAFRGKVHEERNVIAWDTRLHACELAAKFGDHHNEKLDLNVNDNRGERLAALLARLTERASAESDAPGASAVQSHP
jgi:hypothetical protein